MVSGLDLSGRGRRKIIDWTHWRYRGEDGFGNGEGGDEREAQGDGLGQEHRNLRARRAGSRVILPFPRILLPCSENFSYACSIATLLVQDLVNDLQHSIWSKWYLIPVILSERWVDLKERSVLPGLKIFLQKFMTRRVSFGKKAFVSSNDPFFAPLVIVTRKAKDVIKSIKKCVGSRSKNVQLYAVMVSYMCRISSHCDLILWSTAVVRVLD